MEHHRAALAENKLIRFVTITNWGAFLVATVVSLVFAPGPMAWGVIVGGILAMINFHFMREALQKSLNTQRQGKVSASVAKYLLRFAACAIIIGVLISRHLVHPIGLLLGLSVVVISLLLTTLNETRKMLLTC